MLRPYTVARYGIYFALGVAALSVWLGNQAGASLDYVLLRAVFVFVIFTAIAFGAEAVLSVNLPPSVVQPRVQPLEQLEDEEVQ